MSDDEIVTLSDVLEEEAHWEETTNAVLGGSDNKNCSYNQGYVNRQALYSCLTCTPVDAPNFSPAGLCLACSLKCHDGHELVELYTKRNFRCDCGNKKFPDSPCSLEPRKDDYNEQNTYNQNFRGLYCECHRPYPDPEEDEEEDDEMIQCISCEDWLHGRHTGNDSFDLESEQAAEFICEACTKKNTFLAHYSHLNLACEPNPSLIIAEKPNNDDVETVDVDHCKRVDETDCESGEIIEPSSVVLLSGSNKINESSISAGDIESGSQDTRDSGIASGDGSIGDTIEESQYEVTPEAGTSRIEINQTAQCFIEGKMISDVKECKGSTWWSHGWRSKLCRCVKCLELYKTLGVSFLIDPEDSLEAYEAKGLKDGVSTFDSTQALMQSALSQLDRVAQIEFLHGFNEMKENLVEFLRNIGDAGRVVTAADIRQFFGEMQATKRRRLDDVHIPDNCR